MPENKKDKYEIAIQIDHIMPCIICAHRNNDEHCHDCVWVSESGQFSEEEVLELMRQELEKRRHG